MNGFSINFTNLRKRVPGLRDAAPPSEVKVYKMVDGKKVLDHIEQPQYKKYPFNRV